MKLMSLSLNCFRLDEMRQFYSMLGVDFSSKQISLGSMSYRADFNGVEVTLLPADKMFSGLINANQKLSLPAYQITMAVLKIEPIIQKLKTTFPQSILSDVIPDAQGSFALLEDPQGNKVQLVEASA